MGEYQKQIDNLKAQAQKFIELQEAEKRKKAEAEANKARSRKELMLWLERFIDTHIRFGTLTAAHVETYLIEYRKSYGDDASIAKYIGIVAQLLTHPFYGVESNTHRVGNGGLIFKGKTYKDAKELYEALVGLMAGVDPLDSQVWFDYLLTQVFDDPTFLPAEVLLPRWRTDFVPKLVQLVELEKNSLQVPDLDLLNTDDVFVIQSLLGSF
ncbi:MULTISPECIES: hypothetical protein [Nostoc]|uniref:Uncharacterized protein n=1 Tax=Nostoc paludosum FACHB-159 TaxID=2692908 RepID=A0ABR8KL71_9NOSO|nr:MULTISPECIES: hypothetical protein [Nostoc]MBD2683232.1 hypothetical protein [Nostoc sp. FACHB-857]MBD2739559.1 hypothetical protein [Nostoc paludosum FACHB-159]